MRFKVFSLVAVCSALLWFFSGEEKKNTRGMAPRPKTKHSSQSLSHTPAPPASTKAKPEPTVARQVAQTDDSQWEDKLSKLETCYQVEGSCGFSLDDPKAEFFAIGQEIKKVLLKLEHEVRTNGMQSEELVTLARHHLASFDGHVKEAALHLMASQEPDLRNVDTILKEVINYHDARLIPLALLELTRYLGQGQDQKIHQGLTQAMLQGAPFVSLEIAKGINPFLNAQSYDVYEIALQKLRPTSRTKWHLKVTLEEYEKRQTAG